MPAPCPPNNAFSIWGEALAESKVAPAPALNPAASSFYLPSPSAMDPASSPFCPEKKVLAVKSSSLPDNEREDASLQRSAWKQAKGPKGAPCNVARTPAGKVVPRTQRARVTAVRPPTPPRTRSSSNIKRAPEKIAKKADPAPSHLKKHLDALQSLPLVRSGLSDLLDGLAVLPSAAALSSVDSFVLPGEVCA